MCQKAIEDYSPEMHRSLVSQVALCLICAKTLPTQRMIGASKGPTRADLIH